ncbi:hypothetical protein CO657_35995 (plasmid) [Rhizobium acidisoli]|uniref:Uncharacterized protein n=1 Tax=Rhizobium acidisoli TaxID=1538158 RepID=A0AAE6C568_9HYPH|nr:hypothetical protein CO657_35995 [Rhizobium acidisoli]
MHLLPQSFVFQATQSSSQGAPDGTAAPPPSRCSILSKSLPHLLPRQAFSFSDTIKLEFRRYSRLPCSTGSQDVETIVDSYDSRDEMISASSIRDVRSQRTPAERI